MKKILSIIFLFFTKPILQKNFPIKLIKDDIDITDQYLDCQDNTCTFQLVRFIYKKSFSIIRNKDKPIGNITKLRLYNAFLASEDNNEGSFLLDLNENALEIEFEQCSIITNIIKINAYYVKAILSTFTYGAAAFNCENCIIFVDSEIRNLKNNCDMNFGEDVLKKVFSQHDKWKCGSFLKKKYNKFSLQSFYDIYNSTLKFDTFPLDSDQVNKKIIIFFREFFIYFLD